MCKTTIAFFLMTMTALSSGQSFNDILGRSSGSQKSVPPNFGKSLDFDPTNAKGQLGPGYLPPSSTTPGPAYLPPVTTTTTTTTTPTPPTYLPPKSTSGPKYLPPPPKSTLATTRKPYTYMPRMGTFPPAIRYTYPTYKYPTYVTYSRMIPPVTLPPLTTTTKKKEEYYYEKPQNAFNFEDNFLFKPPK